MKKENGTAEEAMFGFDLFSGKSASEKEENIVNGIIILISGVLFLALMALPIIGAAIAIFQAVFG